MRVLDREFESADTAIRYANEKLRVARDEFLAIYRILRDLGIDDELASEIRVLDPLDAMPIIGKLARERLDDSPGESIVTTRARHVITYIDDKKEHSVNEISEILEKLMGRVPHPTSLYRVIREIPKVDRRFVAKKSLKTGYLVVVMR